MRLRFSVTSCSIGNIFVDCTFELPIEIYGSIKQHNVTRNYSCFFSPGMRAVGEILMLSDNLHSLDNDNHLSSMLALFKR